MKIMPGSYIPVIILMVMAGCSSCLAAGCDVSNPALASSPVLPLQGGAITVGPDVSNGTIVWHQHFRPTSPVTLDCKNEIPIASSIRGYFATGLRPSNWSDGRFPPGSVYQTDVPGIGVAVYAYDSTQYTVPFTYPLTAIQKDNYPNDKWMPHEGIEFDVVLIKTGVIIPGRIGGENLPSVNYSLHSKDRSPVSLGSLRFSGEINIISRTCITPDINVPMGDYEISGTFKQTGNHSPWKDASIKLVDCPRLHGIITEGKGAESGRLQDGDKISNSIKLSLSPNTSIINSSQGILGLKNGTDSASGVGIQLAWGNLSDASPQMVNFSENKQYILPDDGSTLFSLPLLARYIQTAPLVTPGKADATVTFTIYYY
ncbi:type 1 fimbrial protein [Erwinia psidii]|uniref:fimbrial protein n=1 Tax=Erwinia psidii TaxID=69224 RepID=UPI00226B8551|nr:fimbrial protein [Erwinia psidii]MCX8960887.1 type 1 fimbrial protein [Erwinia psidii]MCX8964873.1 type 1 fimbrial protein [Erwinia psidii]